VGQGQEVGRGDVPHVGKIPGLEAVAVDPRLPSPTCFPCRFKDLTTTTESFTCSKTWLALKARARTGHRNTRRRIKSPHRPLIPFLIPRFISAIIAAPPKKRGFGGNLRRFG